MARRYDLRTTRDPYDRFWGVLAFFVAVAVLAAVLGETVAVVVVAGLFLWWVFMRFADAYAKHREP